MINLKPLFLFGYTENGKDILGNPIRTFEQIGQSEGKFSSWTSEEIALDVRDVTKYNRKILTTASKSLLEQAEKVYFEDKYHDIREIKGDDSTRWRIIVVERFGSDEV